MQNTEVKEPKIKKVFICSPFRPRAASDGERKNELETNIDRAQAACKFAVSKGYVPFAPHLYFPLFLSEADEDEREMGILLGLTWLARCDELWVIGDRVSEGMKKEIAKAREWNIPVRHFTAKRIVDECFLDFINELMGGRKVW